MTQDNLGERLNHEHFYQAFLTKNPYPRQLKTYDIIEGVSPAVKLKYQGRTLINFSSSDYLNLATHPLLRERSQLFANEYGVGAGASRLVTGNFSCYTTLEKNLASALGKPAALILGSGFQANISLLHALFDKNILAQEPLIFCDKYCHISMQLAAQQNVRLMRFAHNDLQHLQRLLQKYSQTSQPKFILAESIYSMEGDQTNLVELIALAREHHAFLYIDDAHAVGVYGENGYGLAPAFANEIPLIMGTFSKALGSFGAYIGCSETLRDYFINKCKGLIYSTGLSPAMLGAISAALELLPTLDSQRKKILQHASEVRAAFIDLGLDIGHSSTHIIPWIIGDAERTRRIATYLENLKVLGVAIQPPSVPAHKSRIRFCINAGHTQADIACLLAAVKEAHQACY